MRGADVEGWIPLGYFPEYDAKPQCRKHYKRTYLYRECGAQPCDRKSRVPVRLANPSLPGHRSDAPETDHPLGCGRPLLSGIVTPMRETP
jgi:hypothetical protein